MLLTKRYRHIVALVIIQALLFVLYSVRLHFNNYDSRTLSTDKAIQWLSIEQLNNTTQGNTTEANSQNITTHSGQLQIASAEVTTLGLLANANVTTSGLLTSADVTAERYITSSWPLVTDDISADITDLMLTSPVNDVTRINVNNATRILNHSERNDVVKVKKTNHNLFPGSTLSFPTSKNDMSPECVDSFLKRYSDYCRYTIVRAAKKRMGNASALCPCIPQTLIGAYKVTIDEKDFQQTKAEHPELLSGGHWVPGSCVALQRIAIIVPFRNRESHLKVFLRIIHPFLQRQLTDYTVFVVEQESPATFNKASLMNAGFLEIRSRYKIDCFIFHDVDMLPEDDRNFYGCYKSPRHIGAYVNKYKYNLLYNDIFGGATAFTERQFVFLNGYSNEFYGWGGEDDDMFNRIKWRHLNYLRFPKCIARYTMIRHKRDQSNPYNQTRADRAWSMRPKVYMKNGLNSLSYRLVNIEEKPLFTRILIALNFSSSH